MPTWANKEDVRMRSTGRRIILSLAVSSASLISIFALFSTALLASHKASGDVYYQTIGDPLFATDGYHIQADSDARWRGLPTDISTDIDGETRPYHPL